MVDPSGQFGFARAGVTVDCTEQPPGSTVGDVTLHIDHLPVGDVCVVEAMIADRMVAIAEPVIGRGRGRYRFVFHPPFPHHQQAVELRLVNVSQTRRIELQRVRTTAGTDVEL